jgi:GxxExxY protein
VDDAQAAIFSRKEAKKQRGRRMGEVPREIEELAGIAVDCGFRIHKDLGPGLLESAYEAILQAMLERRGLSVERQKPLPIEYDGLILPEGFRIDLLVEGHLLLELKSVERLAPVHGKQLLTYLRLAGQPLGLLMNFGAATFREGVKRVFNARSPFASLRLCVSPNPAAEPDSGLILPGPVE